MILTIDDARRLVTDAMIATGHTADEAGVIADHLMDCELRGLGFGGLARAVSIIERERGAAGERRTITTVKETPVSATIDGGDRVGYLVAQRATDLAIAKVRTSGITVVGAYETWYTGMLAYYLEQVTAAGFAGMAAGSGGHIVAPHGGTQGRFATNPIAFGFPSAAGPVIWDIGTSSITLAEVLLAHRVGRPLPDGAAFDGDGQPTTDPMAALGGALTVWGGHKGSGLALVVQLLGMMCGAAADPDGLRDCGFFLLVVDPALLTPVDDYPQRVADYAELLRSTRPVDLDRPVRVPFDRSVAERAARRAEGTINVADEVHHILVELTSSAGHSPA